MPSESKNRMQSHWNESDDKPLFSRCSESAEQMIEQNPIGVTLGFFAAGLGVGAMIGCALAEPMGFRQRATAETIGRRFLDSISDLIPDSVNRQFR